MRLIMIAGNWKMNTTVGEAINLIKQIIPQVNDTAGVEVVLCPPYVSLVPAYKLVQGSHTRLGAQNLFYEEKGAYTGEISPLMLSDLCEYVIIGHSERRQYFQETGDIISKKVNAAIKNNLKPILCVGENLVQYESGKTREVVGSQLESSLSGVSGADKLTIAYEPVWAIGTGKAATGKQANETVNMIRLFISIKYGTEIADNMRILYGGSVTPANISEFVSQPDIDGALVGGASLKAGDFAEIVKLASKAKGNSH